MNGVIVNRVAESGLETIDLATFLPKHQPLLFDLKDYLFKGLILREKEFRTALTTLDWTQYQGKTVLVTCSADVVIPMWAYMLVATNLSPFANDMFLMNEAQWRNQELIKAIRNIETEAYRDRRVVIKGCGKEPISEEAYFEITKKLQPVVKSILYGEPCSTVPVYKKSKTSSENQP
jgi:hypothetical protein